jgi:D-amino peptidase
MHARNNTPDGVLCHTISGVQYKNLWFNDDLVGETGVNAALNGHYGVPVVLVTGDEAVCREAKQLLGDNLPTVAVKKGLSRFSARQIAPARARQMIEEAAKNALNDLAVTKPYVPEVPTTIKIEVVSVDKLAEFKGRSGVEITGPLTVESKAVDWMTAWNQFWPFA